MKTAKKAKKRDKITSAPPKRTQSQRGSTLLAELEKGPYDDLESPLWALIRESGNAPPYGHADGSITPERFEILNRAARAISMIKSALRDWYYAP